MKCICFTGVCYESSQCGINFMMKECPSEEAFALLVPRTLSFWTRTLVGHEKPEGKGKVSVDQRLFRCLWLIERAPPSVQWTWLSQCLGPHLTPGSLNENSGWVGPWAVHLLIYPCSGVTQLNRELFGARNELLFIFTCTVLCIPASQKWIS